MFINRADTLAKLQLLERSFLPNFLFGPDNVVVTIGIDGLSRSPGMTGRYRLPVYLPEVPGLYFAGDCYTGRGVGMNTAASSAMICVREILARQGR